MRPVLHSYGYRDRSFLLRNTLLPIGNTEAFMTGPPVVAPTKSVDEAIQDVLKTQVPWLVMLHNDDHHAMDYVVESLCKAVDTLSSQDAINIMIEAHTKGVGIVGSWRLELAEFYRDRIKTFGLRVTIEKG